MGWVKQRKKTENEPAHCRRNAKLLIRYHRTRANSGVR